MIPRLIAATVMIGAAVSLPQAAEAQRRAAPVSQGVTNADLAVTVELLRRANGDLTARVTDLEADKAALTGEVETLKFLLSQSRDQVNAMQDDDAALARLITRLERRINDQDAALRDLERQVSSLTSTTTDRLDDANARSTATSTGIDLATLTDPSPSSQVSTSGLQPRRIGPTSGSTTTETTTPQTTTGPTRIVRRTVTGGNSAPQGPEQQVALTGTTPVASAGSGDFETPPTAGTLGTIPASALPGEAGPLFAEAKSRLLQFNYAGSEQAFRAFLDQFGDDPQAGEAQYWLGEVLYQQEAYAESGTAYTQMIREYPDDPRAPEALAKLARSMRLVGDSDRACQALDLLNDQYPDASGVTRTLAAGERVRSGCDA
ncbi:MAG: tol-pal system protein YbgF [Pseudomonadota bacterium]